MGVQSFSLNKLMLCRLRLHYAGLYAISARCTYCALPIYPVSSAASGLTPFPACSPMSIDTGWGDSRVGPRSRSTTVGSPFVHRRPGRPYYAGVRVELTTGSPLSRGVSRCRSAHPATVICITVVVLGGCFYCTNLPWGTNLRKCFLPPRPVG